MSDFKEKYDFTKEEWDACIKVLTSLKGNPYNNPNNQLFGALITKLSKQAKKLVKAEQSKSNKDEDLNILKSSTIAANALNNRTVFSEGLPSFEHQYTSTKKSRNCYCCNEQYNQIHSFYHRMCPSCAEENYANRFLNVDLTGRHVILTGGRVKIGYSAALKFLRNNAHLTVTTRFPYLALNEFKKEEDYPLWKDRLDIYGLDLRNLKAVYQFIDHYQKKKGHLDILVNNAAQTIKYTDSYYTPIVQKEYLEAQKEENKLLVAPNATPVFSSQQQLLDIGVDFDISLNRFNQPVDNRLKNSWNSTLEEVELPELLEVNLINHISPYILIKGLMPCFGASPFKDKYIINVSSSEGQFSYSNKSMYHPHTNMTKAALNMLTRTSSKEFVRKGIYMTSVDVGWVSTGAIEPLRKKQFEDAYIPPLDPVDGGARIIHPIHEGIQSRNFMHGVLLKNYKVVDW